MLVGNLFLDIYFTFELITCSCGTHKFELLSFSFWMISMRYPSGSGRVSGNQAIRVLRSFLLTECKRKIVHFPVLQLLGKRHSILF